jgi:hypothetical protein
MSLAALRTALNSVNINTGLFAKLMMFFKSRENIWTYGPKNIQPEEGSRWAANPTTFERGYIAFDGTKRLGERMLSVGLPEINPADLPDVGAPWQQQMSVEMKCLDGADAGVEVCFKTATEGGRSCIKQLIGQVRDRINAGQHGDEIVPIVLPEKDGYQNVKYGWTATPLLTLVGWMSLHGPAPAPVPAPTPPSAPTASVEQPRRRRVV